MLILSVWHSDLINATFWVPWPLVPALYPLPLVTTNLLLVSMRVFLVLLQIPHTSEVMWYLSFSDGLSIVSLRSIHIVIVGRTSFFLWMINNLLYRYAIFSLSTHPSMDTWVVHVSWVMWVWGCRYCFETAISFSLNKYRWNYWIIQWFYF